MRLRLVVLVLAVACAGVAACGSPAPLPRGSAFVAHDAHFSASFPATPSRSAQQVKQGGATVTEILYAATTSTQQIGVGYFRLAQPPRAGSENAFLDAAMQGSATSLSGSVRHRSHLSFLSDPAEDAVIVASGIQAHERILLAGSVVYILIGAAESSTAPPGYATLLSSFRVV